MVLIVAVYALHRTGFCDVGYVTVTGVELISAGMEWSASTGSVTITMEHLADAVLAANEDPHILAPRLKLGHSDTRFNAGPDWDPFNQDGAPAFGRVENLRLANDGAVIVGDFVEVPEWLAAAMPSAYPSRSAEAVFDVQTPGDRRYSMVLTAVALLGTALPAVQDLEDLQRVLVEGPADLVAAAAAEGTDRVSTRKGAPAAASVSTDVVRRRFNYDWATSNPIEGLDTYWWWVRDIRLDPDEVIADDDMGGLWLVPFSTDGEDEVTFGEPIAVRTTYVPVAASGTLAPPPTVRMRHGQRELATALERPSKPRPAGAAGSRPDSEGSSMDPAEIRQLLGLAEDATDDDVREAMRLRAPEPAAGDEPDAEPEGDGEPAPEAVVPEPVAASADTVTVDRATWEAMRSGAADGQAARAEQLRVHREEVVAAAVADGRIPPARREHWLRQIETDPGAEQVLAGLERGLIPVTERGTAPSATTDEFAEHEAVMASFGVSTRKGA